MNLTDPQFPASLVVSTAVLLSVYDPGMVRRRRYVQVLVLGLVPAALGELLFHHWLPTWWAWPAGAAAAAVTCAAVYAASRLRRRFARADT